MSAHFADLLVPSTLTLATCGPDGEPHAAPVYFAAGELPPGEEAQVDPAALKRALHLYFFSDPHSQHSQDVSGNPRAAVAFYPESESWQEIRGIQMRGEVQAVQPGAQWDLAWKYYRARFPFVTELEAIVARNTLYVFIPDWIRLIDNRKGFGYKEEWTLP